jgi:hypothetical protein
VELHSELLPRLLKLSFVAPLQRQFTIMLSLPSLCCREAVAHPEAAVKLSCKQERACQLRAVCRALPPDTSRIRQRPKRARDAFGAGMVPVVNVVLVWLMFSIDVRNAMLR